MQKIVERIRVRLTIEELHRKAQELARHLQETTALDEQRKVQQKAFNEQMRDRERFAAQLATDINSETEERDVECVEQPRWSERLVDIVRVDTREIVRTRVMQTEERQTHLELVRRSEREDEDEDDANPPTH